MIWAIVRSQVSNKVLRAVPPPVDPAEQLLPLSYIFAVSHLHSGYFSRLQTKRHSVGWANDTNIPHLFSCPTHPTDLVPGDMWMAPLQVAQFLADLPQFANLPPLQIDFINSFHLSLSPLALSSLRPSAGPLHLTSCHVTQWPGC